MKKLLPVLLCLIMLAGCNKTPYVEPTPEESAYTPFVFTQENFPRVDGSTATIPLIEAVESALLKKPREDIDVNVSKTSGAYVALSEDSADILLVYDGGEETRTQVNADARFETVPIGKDALIFVVNRDNPVDNITTEQAQKIFTGEYTNWNQVGGSDEPIRAFQRGIGSGSQALMDKLVMDGLEMADPVMIPVIGAMGGLIDAVANFTSGPGAIGYNVYYYVTEMRENDYIKVLSIDGVEPNYDPIQSDEYPFVSEFYSVIRKSEPENSPARVLHEWMLTEEAQNLMASENYVALHSNPNADTPQVNGEFSHYPEGEEPLYFEGLNYYSLEARDDYGQLYFYLGTMRREHGEMNLSFGICTADGKIVTKPVYSAPRLLTDSEGNKAYLCYRADKAPKSEIVQYEGGSYEREIYPVLLFATDGTWIREFDGEKPFYGFAGAGNLIMNADHLAVMQGDKWGAVNMKGETVIPFDRDSSEGIYNDSPTGPDGSPYLGITENRFLGFSFGNISDSGYSLYDANHNLIATGLQGMPSGRSGEFIVTNESGLNINGTTVRTYTLDGQLIATLENVQGDFTNAFPFGDYVRVFTAEGDTIFDKNLKVICEFPQPDDKDSSRYNTHYDTRLNVMLITDTGALFHRTYLPDGTRLVTWYDPEMNDSIQ